MGRPSLQSPFQFNPKVLDGVKVRALCSGQSSYSTNSKHVFMDQALWIGAQSCWGKQEPSHKAGRIALCKKSWYAEAIRFTFIRKGLGP